MVVEMESKTWSLSSHEKMQNVLIKHKSGRKRYQEIIKHDFTNHSESFCFKLKPDMNNTFDK